MTKPHVRYVVFRYGHHSPHSGYARTAEFGVSEYDGEIITVSKPLPKAIIRQRLLWRLAKDAPGYDRTSMAAELKVAWHMLKEQEWIYHFLYGETTYNHIARLNNFRQNRLVATFHLPPYGLNRVIQRDSHLRQLSAVVCVGRNQQEFFNKLVDPDRVFFVPLGVDTDYFTPPASFEDRDPDLCLFVGSNYRDFPTFRGVIELVSYLRPQTRFLAVTSAKAAEQIGSHPNLCVRSGIPEDEFRDLYRSASLMVMPLHEATANNAILEAMACGLPLVISDVGAIRDYVNPESGAILPPHDSRCMANTVLGLLEAPSNRQQMSKHARENALQLAWPKVVKQLEAVYQAVA
ncbi:MAG: glycosyltransferase family 4 protein [Anaerolineae bacterium]|nr:glycosyltransferase family 4 protein [Anaerolineae bacterium]MCB9107507.1 glycosyltransferase family 4 protein [Anaerolineales bacterium]